MSLPSYITANMPRAAILSILLLICITDTPSDFDDVMPTAVDAYSRIKSGQYLMYGIPRTIDIPE